MKQFGIVLFTVDTLKDASSLDVSNCDALKKYVEDGFILDHLSAPVIIPLNDGSYSVAATVTLEKGPNMRDVVMDYIQEVSPMVKGLLNPYLDMSIPKTAGEYEQEINKLIVPKLKDLAETKGIEGYKKMNKATLVKSLVQLYEFDMSGAVAVPTFVEGKETPLEEIKEVPPVPRSEAPPEETKPEETSAPKEKKLTKAQLNRERRAGKRAAQIEKNQTKK